MKIWIVLFSFFGLLALFLYVNSSPFDVTNLYQEIPKCNKEIPQEVISILNQPFAFLGKGAQVYAFVSKDGDYVLKLFKAKHGKPRKFFRRVRALFNSPKQKAISRQKWRNKFQETCQRNQIAFELLREETELVYLHFERSQIPVYVNLNEKKPLLLDISQYPFLIQKKAELIPDYFFKIVLQKDMEKFHTSKNALKELFVKRAQKGFSDPRQVLHLNYGFVEGKPIQIDVGKLESLTIPVEEEIQKIHAHIDLWFERHFPHMELCH